jgi:hypothetical protein
MPPHLNQVAPVFVVADVGATVRWYQEYLGFRFHHFPKTEPWVWASMSRDGVEIMLLRIEGYQKADISPLRPPDLWDAYLRTQGVREFYDMVRTKLAIKLELTQHPYGDWEFEIRDPNGYVLVFSELLDDK